MNQKIKIKNQLRDAYNVGSINHALCADVTLLGYLGELYLIIDLASRAIVGHAYTSKHVDTELVIKTNLLVLQQRRFLPVVKIIHTDRGSIFRNDLYEQTMQKQNVIVSRGDAKAFQNQAIESLNRTIKRILKTIIMVNKINPETDRKVIQSTPVFHTQYVEPKQMEIFVKSAIEIYNNKKHSKLKSLTPNLMEEAYFHKNQTEHSKVDPVVTENGSIEDAAMQVFQAQVVQEFKGDWQRFFIEWREKQEKQHIEVITSQGVIIKKLDKRAIEAELNEKALLVKYESLYEKHMQVHKEITFLYEQEEAKKIAEETRAEAKLRKKQAKQQNLRQTITTDEFLLIIKIVKTKAKYLKARRILALYLLYLTGLRVTNLLNLNVGQVNQLLQRAHTDITLIKRGAKRHPIRLAYKGHLLIKTIEDHINILSQNKSQDDPIFTTQHSIHEPISSYTFERELNNILTIASSMLNKHIRTHSFRATLITDLLKNKVPIHEVQQIMGHQSIGATLLYNRTGMTVKDIDKQMSKRHRISADSIDTKI